MAVSQTGIGKEIEQQHLQQQQTQFQLSAEHNSNPPINPHLQLPPPPSPPTHPSTQLPPPTPPSQPDIQGVLGQQQQDVLLPIQGMANLNLSVSQAAVEDPHDSQSQSAIAFVEERLKLGNGWVSLPDEVRLSGDPSRRIGEQAEEVVHNRLQKAQQDIPGLKITLFNGIRLTGRTASSGDLESIREVDNVVFLEHKGSFFCKIFETKSNKIADKKAKDRKKDGINQLRNITDILTDGLDIDADIIQTHMVWPNLSHEESCRDCRKKKIFCKYPTFTKLLHGSPCPHFHPHPDPEPVNFHLFRNTFPGNNFSTWLEKEVTDPSNAITREAYEKILSKVLLFSAGVLHDSQMETFCVLNPDQRALVTSTDHTLRRPTGVIGLAGTGKTICVCARIQRHFKNGDLSDTSKAAYIYFNKNVKNLVERKLLSSGVNTKFVDFIDYSANDADIQNVLTDESVLNDIIHERNIRYIFFDGAEDVGIEKLNKLLEIMLNMKPDEDEEGDFWLLFDGFQSLDTEDIHNIEKDEFDQLFWTGNQIDPVKLEEGIRSGRITRLSTSFRMTQSILDHIKEKNVLPISNMPRSLKVKGTPVKKPETIDTNNIHIEEAIASKVWELAQKRSIHCGHIGLLYDDDNTDQLFPSGVQDSAEKINATLKSKVVDNQKMYIPQVTTVMDESLHYKHHQIIPGDRDLIANKECDVRNTAQYQFDNHTQPLLRCQCKVYLGSTKEIKGNEARVVIFLHCTDRNRQGELEGNGMHDTDKKVILHTAERKEENIPEGKIPEKKIPVKKEENIPEEKYPEEKISVLKTSSYYIAASRSLCEVHILKILSTIPTQIVRGTPVKIFDKVWIPSDDKLQRTPEPLIVTTSNSYSQHSQLTPEPVKVPTYNNFNIAHKPVSQSVPTTSETITSNKSDPVQMEERLVPRKFTQHRMDHSGTPILLLNFYSKFTLLIPEKEEFLEEQEATVEVKTQHFGDKKKLTFIRFIFDSTNAERELTAPVLHAEHLETGMELIRNQTPCVFLGQPFQNVEDVPEPLESCSPNQLLISPSPSSVYSSPMEAYQALHGDQPKVPTSPLTISSTFPSEHNSKKFEESKISTPKTLKRIETWMNKSPSAMAASSRVEKTTQHTDRIDTSNSSIKQLLLNHKPRLTNPTAGSTNELSPLELPTIIPHKSSQNVSDRQFKSPPFVTNPRLEISQLPISGDVIMGTHGGQAVALISEKQSPYVGSEFQRSVSLAAKPQSSNSRKPVEDVIYSENLDEPPQKICRIDPKPGCSYKATVPLVPELIPTILAPYSSPPGHESQNYDGSPEQNEYALKLAELEKRLNEPLPIPSQKNPVSGKEEITVLSDVEDAEEEVEEEEESEESNDGNEDESDEVEKAEEVPEIKSSVIARPGSTRGRLKNCDKISRWLVTLLRDPNCNPSVITWIRPEEGIFKIVNSSKLAVLWGKKKGNPNMDYSKLSRAMRYYYKTGELEVVNSRLTYRFGDRMTNWEPVNAADPNFMAGQ